MNEFTGVTMDQDGKQKSSLGNDAKLDREKNKVTGVKNQRQTAGTKKLGR